jgi:peptidoglycan/LPS O-acetylase OafA/YrhL
MASSQPREAPLREHDTTVGWDQGDKLQAVDALRGYAILLVVCAHSLRHVPELLWPAKRFLLLGVYGVQLFFLASALTLLMSWSRSSTPFPQRCRDFFIHRFFRIAPLYFLAIGFYWIVDRRGAEEFSTAVLSASLFFYNAWSPYFIRTVPGWIPVPGGWSIGVEFCFYLVFPLLATGLVSLRRAAWFAGAALLLMLVASSAGQLLYPEISVEERANFLYFWPPNHLIIFALGFMLYQLLKLERVRSAVAASRLDVSAVSLLLLLALFGLSLYGMRKAMDWTTGLPPTHLLITLCFLPWALWVVLRPNALVVNRAIVAFGKVSFSVYILHFAVLGWVSSWLERVWSLPRTQLWSLAYEGALLVLACGFTFCLAWLTYRFIEKPFIQYGKSLTRQRHPLPLAATPAA